MIKTEQIKEVYFERVFNLGNYESFRLGLHATIGPKQTVEEVIADLDAFTMKNPGASSWVSKIVL